jgi:uncharacterized Zn finger protein (UPF0148 family)
VVWPEFRAATLRLIGGRMFENLLRELRALDGQQVTVSINADEKGYVDKECPATNCEFLFKINEQDWKHICRDEAVWCPMCGHSTHAESWFTKAQIAHAERQAHKFVESKIDGAMRADSRAFNSKQPKNSFISMSMKVNGVPHFSSYKVPAAASEAMQLEIKCEKCACRFAVIGSAYFCPSCGHNSVDRVFDDSLRKIKAKKDNIELVRTAIAGLGKKDEAELTCRSLIESCLLDGVTAFQKCCEGLYASTSPTAQAPTNSFQRLSQGSDLWKAQAGVGYADILTGSELARLKMLFQRRHLLAHSDGIVDQRYVNESGDTTYKVGQRITVSDADVDDIVAGIGKLVTEIRKAARSLPKEP